MRFYTLPPSGVYWNYVFLNAKHPTPGISYLQRQGKVRSIILDCGVSIFKDPSVKDYPANHLDNLVDLYKKLTCHADEVYAVPPDYPDDFNPKSLWTDKTNIERTVESVLTVVNKYPWVNWLIPLQGFNEQPESIKRCIDLYNDLGVTERFDYFAVANLCVSRRSKTIIDTVNTAKKLLPNKRLHAFGVSVTALKKLRDVLYSFDSMAYTFPRKRGLPSCRNLEEKRRYFYEYIQRLKELELLSEQEMT
jgi:hypothetical protein